MTERSDAELVSAHLMGDSGALAAIYDRYADALYDTAAAMLNDRHDAEDLAHDVFVVASRSLGQLRDPSRLKPWLFAILRHEVYKRTKRRARSRPTDFTATGVGEMAAPHDPDAGGADAERGELAAFVRAAAAGLAERDQLLLELSARQGLSGADLAAAVGVTPEQCHVLVHRMRERVQRSIGALTVARYGRKDCPDLQTLLRKWNGVFDPPTRKRIAGHVDDCAVCRETSRTYAVVPLVAAAPALAAPASLRDRVLSSTAGTTGVGVGGADTEYRFDVDGGFPHVAGGGRRLVAIIAVAVVVILLLGGTWLAAVAGDEGNDRQTAGTSADASDGVGQPAAPNTADAVASTAPEGPDPTTSVTATSGSASTLPPDDATTSTSTTTTTTTTTTSTTATTTTTTSETQVPAITEPPPEPPPPEPPPPPPPSAGRLALSSGTVDLGASATSAAITVSNVGGQPLDWSITGDPSPFTLSQLGGALAPGAAAQLTVALDRAPLLEGDVVRALAITSSAEGTAGVNLVAAVERPPVVTVASATSSLVCPFALGALMRVTVTDESAIDSVVLSWSGPGAPGSSPMRLGALGWTGRVTPEAVDGTWTWVATATDARGNTGSAGAPLVVAGC